MALDDKKRKKRLRDIEINEVSWVDRPANQIPFLFWKQADIESVDLNKTDTKLDISFSTKGTPDSTKITVNGSKVDASYFSLYYSPISGTDNISLGCEYTVKAKGESNGGFSASRTYSLYKNVEQGKQSISEQKEFIEPDANDIETITEFLGEPVEDIDAPLAKALSTQITLMKSYMDACPEDFLTAIKDIVKLASTAEIVGEVETVEKKEVTEKETKEVKETKEEVKEVTQTVEQTIDVNDLTSKIVDGVMSKINELQALKEKETKEAEETKPAAVDDEVSPEEAAQILADAVSEAIEESN